MVWFKSETARAVGLEEESWEADDLSESDCRADSSNIPVRNWFYMLLYAWDLAEVKSGMYHEEAGRGF